MKKKREMRMPLRWAGREFIPYVLGEGERVLLVVLQYCSVCGLAPYSGTASPGNFLAEKAAVKE